MFNLEKIVNNWETYPPFIQKLPIATFEDLIIALLVIEKHDLENENNFLQKKVTKKTKKIQPTDTKLKSKLKM